MVTTEAVAFEVGRSTVAGTLVRPEGDPQPPVVVMGHGFGARRTWGLPAFAERFAEAGVAALAVDYRGFGDSAGGPRGVISARRQREDYRTAVAYARQRGDLDGDAVGLWGMSFSGGHVVALAAAMEVQAVVATVPFTDGLAASVHFLRRAGLEYARRIAGATARDALATVLDRQPHYVPVVGEGENFGILAAPDAYEHYRRMIPSEEREDWQNRTAARVFLEIPFERPVTVADAVDAPVFVLQATDDHVVPPGSIDRLVDALDDVHRVRLPLGHFDPIAGPAADAVATRQARFLAEHLR